MQVFRRLIDKLRNNLLDRMIDFTLKILEDGMIRQNLVQVPTYMQIYHDGGNSIITNSGRYAGSNL